MADFNDSTAGYACVRVCVLVAIRLIMQRPLNELHGVMASHRLPGSIIVEEQLGFRDILVHFFH